MGEQRSPVSLLTSSTIRLMSDYDVTLVNDSMQEFYVWFYGPSESAQFLSHTHSAFTLMSVGAFSSIRWWNLEDPRRTA
jgi:hypothetical protein